MEAGKYAAACRSRRFSSPSMLTSYPSRQAITKYIKANNKLGTATDATVSTHINAALRAGERSGDFLRPKGASGTVKLANKNAAAKPTAPKPAAKASTASAEPKTKVQWSNVRTQTTITDRCNCTEDRRCQEDIHHRRKEGSIYCIQGKD